MRSLRLLPFAALAACSPADARESLVTVDTLPGGIPLVSTQAPIDAGRWTLVHERDVQPPIDLPGELIDPQDLALRDDGTLLVAESGPAQVKVYDPSGAFVRAIGREGAGPGEFGAAFIAVRGDTLVVQDPRNQRATSFRISDGELLVERITTCCYYAPITIDDRGRAVVRTMSNPDGDGDPRTAFLRFPIGGTAVESLMVVDRPEPDDRPAWRIGDGKRMMMMMSVPLQPRSEHASHPSGVLVTGWAGEYRLRFTSDGRDSVRLFGRPWTAEPVTAAEKQRIVDDRVAQQMSAGSAMRMTEEQWRQALDPAAIPDHRPAFASIWSDGSGRVWLRRPVGDTAAVHLDLFDAEGRWLDQVIVAEPLWATRSYLPLSFSRDRLALLLEDADGFPVVRIYRIERRDA